MKALVVCTNHTDFRTKPQKTGLWLSEATHFYDELQDRNIQFDFASPQGGPIPIDQRSAESRDTTNEKWMHNPVFQDKLTHSLPLNQVQPDAYQILYLTGGHGTMWDFPNDEALQALVQYVYEHGGLVAAVGHGAAGLLNVTLSDGTPFLKDKQVTGSANVEEKLIRLDGEIPFCLEDELMKRGALYSKSLLPFVPHLEVDERLITGQNPLSARKVGRKVVEEMFEK